MHKVNITDAKYLQFYKINLMFDDGLEGIIDLENMLSKSNSGVFSKLRDLNKFKDFHLENGAIVWSCNLDLAPEFLHDLLIQQNQE